LIVWRRNTEDTESASHILTQRLQRLRTSAAAGGVDADAFGVMVVNGQEHCGLWPTSTLISAKVRCRAKSVSGMPAFLTVD
jgi:hypothetical protein